MRGGEGRKVLLQVLQHGYSICWRVEFLTGPAQFDLMQLKSWWPNEEEEKEREKREERRGDSTGWCIEGFIHIFCQYLMIKSWHLKYSSYSLTLINY